MQPYDIVMILVLVGATVFGAYKGLVWQIASIGAIVVSYLVALQFRQPVSQMINLDPPWNVFVAMLVLYLGTSLGIWIAFRFVSEFIDRLKLKEFDRQVGALFGLAKGIVLCVLITLFAVSLSRDSWRAQIIDSTSGYYIARLLDRSHAVMPEEMHEVLEPYIHSLDERLDGTTNVHDREPHDRSETEEIQEDVKSLFRLSERAKARQERR